MPFEASTDIIDATSLEGLTPETLVMWEAMTKAALDVGLARLNMNAAAGAGHLSHAHGTEIDVSGYNADGSRWTTEQRLAVAQAAASVGGNRFGFYSEGGVATSLHAGLGFEAGPDHEASVFNAAWGPEGATEKVDVSSFLPEERAFVAAVKAGNIDTYLQSSEALSFAPTTPQPLSSDAQVAVNRMASTAPSVAVAVGNGLIVERGDRGDATRELQRFLNLQGMTDANGNALVEDGIFGARTASAVEAYQRDRRIGVDGRVGPETFRAMQADLSDGEPPVFVVKPNVVQDDDGGGAFLLATGTQNRALSPALTTPAASQAAMRAALNPTGLSSVEMPISGPSNPAGDGGRPRTTTALVDQLTAGGQPIRNIPVAAVPQDMWQFYGGFDPAAGRRAVGEVAGYYPIDAIALGPRPVTDEEAAVWDVGEGRFLGAAPKQVGVPTTAAIKPKVRSASTKVALWGPPTRQAEPIPLPARPAVEDVGGPRFMDNTEFKVYLTLRAAQRQRVGLNPMSVK